MTCNVFLTIWFDENIGQTYRQNPLSYTLKGHWKAEEKERAKALHEQSKNQDRWALYIYSLIKYLLHPASLVGRQVRKMFLAGFH